MDYIYSLIPLTMSLYMSLPSMDSPATLPLTLSQSGYTSFASCSRQLWHGASPLLLENTLN